MIERYRREYDLKYREICCRYVNYKIVPESHPKYTETWNFYWLEEFYKLNEHERNATKYDFTPKWRGYWEKRSQELRIEEELEMRVKLRKELGMVVDLEDEHKLKVISDRSKVMIKKKSPSVPIMTTSGLTDVNHPTVVHQEIKEEAAAIKVEPQELPPHISALKNSELVLLFNNIDSLSDVLRDELLELMSFMEVNDPERHQKLLRICLNEPEDVAQKPQESSQNSRQNFAEIDSEESYTLDDVLMRAQGNLEYGPAMTPERYQDVVDLTLE